MIVLTVAVSGGGHVTSKPGGLDCGTMCKTHVRKGAKVTLRATPSAGFAFSRWSAPCGKAPTCTLTISHARVVRAFFTALPPPGPEEGHYAGTYTDGSFFAFDLSRATVANVAFDFNGECSNGGTSFDTGVTFAGPFTVGSDGAFSGTGSLTFPHSTVTATMAGTVATTGTASGTLRVEIAYDDGTTCTSSGTWTAKL